MVAQGLLPAAVPEPPQIEIRGLKNYFLLICPLHFTWGIQLLLFKKAVYNLHTTSFGIAHACLSG